MVAVIAEKFRNRSLPPGHMRGIGFMVVNPQGEIWIQRDKRSKEQTGRNKGDLSIIFETQKSSGKRRRRESHKRNILGAIPELVNDETLFMIKDKLVTTDGLRSTPELTYTSNSGTVIHYIVAVGVLGTPSDHFDPEPFDSGETETIGWMRPEELLAQDKVRPAARQAVSYMQDYGVINKVLTRYHSPLHPNNRIIPRGFGVAKFYEEREQAQDMVPGVFYSVAF
jgi:hypothetical protein